MSKKLTVIIAVLSIVLLGLTVAHFYLNVNQTFSAKAVPLNNDSTRTQPEAPKITNKEPFIVALLGTDAEQQENVSRTDTIMLVRYDMAKKKAVIVSVPRDSYVMIPNKHKDKINAAHAYGGTDLALETLEDLLNIHIDYYAKANFQGFMDVTETLGGVRVNAKKTISYGGVTIQPGEQVLSGEKLLTYVRFRKDSDGDFGRINRQQEVILSAAKEMVKPSSLVKIPQFAEIVQRNVTSNLNWSELIALAMEAKDFSSIDIQQYTLKTHSQKMNGVWYELVDEEDLERLSGYLNGVEPVIELENTNMSTEEETVHGTEGFSTGTDSNSN